MGMKSSGLNVMMDMNTKVLLPQPCVQMENGPRSQSVRVSLLPVPHQWTVRLTVFSILSVPTLHSHVLQRPRPQHLSTLWWQMCLLLQKVLIHVVRLLNSLMLSLFFRDTRRCLLQIQECNMNVKMDTLQSKQTKQPSFAFLETGLKAQCAVSGQCCSNKYFLFNVKETSDTLFKLPKAMIVSCKIRARHGRPVMFVVLKNIKLYT